MKTEEIEKVARENRLLVRIKQDGEIYYFYYWDGGATIKGKWLRHGINYSNLKSLARDLDIYI